MHFRTLLQNNLLHFDSVKLGRFVLNAKNPHQEYFDLPDSQPEFTVKLQSNLKDVLTQSKKSQLRSHLSALLSISNENQNANTITLKASQAKTYQLMNSGAWFEIACAHPKSREWLEHAVIRGKAVYLVVGYHTIIDAEVTQATTSGATTSGGVHLPDPSPIGLSAHVPNLLGSRVNSTRDVSTTSERSFCAPGEQIYAVQYRKLVFKWLSSRGIDHTSLERNNRWKTFWAEERRRVKSESHNAEAEEESFVVLEADLTNELDLGYMCKENYVSQDGEEFMF